MLTLPLSKNLEKEPPKLTLSEDVRIVRLINELIELDESWLDYDTQQIQKLLDHYSYLKKEAFMAAKK